MAQVGQGWGLDGRPRTGDRGWMHLIRKNPFEEFFNSTDQADIARGPIPDYCRLAPGDTPAIVRMERPFGTDRSCAMWLQGQATFHYCAPLRAISWTLRRGATTPSINIIATQHLTFFLSNVLHCMSNTCGTHDRPNSNDNNNDFANHHLTLTSPLGRWSLRYESHLCLRLIGLTRPSFAAAFALAF
jgi:hypothetical protein